MAGVRVIATGFGDRGVLQVVEHVPAKPERGEVTIEVRAAGVNPVDYKTYDGTLGTDRSTLPLSLGWEVSGVVTAVGPDAVGRACRIEIGDEVIAYPISGGYASHVTVAAMAVVPKPATLSFEAAAGLMLTGVTAVHALTGAGVVKGTTVLVHGVSGGVGWPTAQIALADGARVIGTASPRHHDTLRQRGIVPVSYGSGLLERVRQAAPDGIDAAIDTVGTDEAIDVSLALVHEPRLIVSAAAFGRSLDGITLIGFSPGVEADPGHEIRDTARLRLTALANDGKLTVKVALTFSLNDVARAHDLLAEGHAGGKVILTP